MREFYVTYDRGGVKQIGVVVAPLAPANLQFADYEELQATMDALGNAWELRIELEDPFDFAREGTAEWLQRMAAAKAVNPEPKPIESIFALGSIPQP
jgi:hypothetical protein